MTDDDISRIESELQIVVPATYRELLQHDAERLREIAWFGGETTILYLEPEHLIAANLQERLPEATGDAFPNWWDEYFMVGTNGGGDYYCLRLDGSPSVWMIGTDCGVTPTLVAMTFREYVEDCIVDYEAARESEAEAERRRLPYAAETNAHRDAISRDNGPRQALQWMERDSLYILMNMLKELPQKVSPRKLRLYGIACCRLLPGLDEVDDCAAGLRVVERMPLGTADRKEVDRTRKRLSKRLQQVYRLCGKIDREEYRRLLWHTHAVLMLFQADEDYLNDAPWFSGDVPRLVQVCESVSHALYQRPHGTDVEANLLREVLGNTFHPVPFDQAWRTDEALSLAEEAFAQESFIRMPELGEALHAAGCEDQRILAHCARDVGHVRGCWVLDELLQNE